jgi:acetyl esterase/lipase
VRLEVRIALSLLHRGRGHSFGPDPSQVGDLHVPSGRGPFPVAVLLHGGYWQTQYGKLVTRPLALDLVRRGWAVWNLEYRRLGGGRGGGGGWPMTFEDVAAGIDHLAGLDPRLDLSDVSLVGHSAGGQLALWAATRASLPAGVVGCAPRVTASRVLALAPVTDLGRARVHAEVLLGGTAAAVPDRWALTDPVRFGAPPVPALVVHPSGDTTVPPVRSGSTAPGLGVALVETAGCTGTPSTPTSRRGPRR